MKLIKILYLAKIIGMRSSIVKHWKEQAKRSIKNGFDLIPLIYMVIKDH